MITQETIVDFSRLKEFTVQEIFSNLIRNPQAENFLKTEVKESLRSILVKRIELPLCTDWLEIISQDYTVEELELLIEKPTEASLGSKFLEAFYSIRPLRYLANRQLFQHTGLNIPLDKEREASTALFLACLYVLV